MTQDTYPSMAAPVDAAPHRNWRTVAAFLVFLWAWAIAGCLDEWQDNPMYSYGWFVPPLVLFFAWRRLDEPIIGRTLHADGILPSHPGLIAGLTAAAAALFVLPAELLRNEMPDDRLNNWILAIAAIAATLWVVRAIGGNPLLRNLAFPIAFFLTAVAWPKRYENPVTLGLQGFVTSFVVEVMHILGIHADPHGNSIYLRNGPVGIAEACSGIRSLQASLMISLAIGELFYLRTLRRIALVALCAGVATILNLGRTLSLCLITEYQGADAMHKAHDLIGNVVLLALPGAAWLIGRALASNGGAVETAAVQTRPSADGTPPPPTPWQLVRRRANALPWNRMPNFIPAVALGIAGVTAYHAWIHVLDLRDPPQQTPYFADRTAENPALQKIETNPDVWAILNPTSGGSYIAKASNSTDAARLFHFFWKPAAANRWVTGHRPDICMPAGGWTKIAEPKPINITIDGQELEFTAFQFQSPTHRALQLWGIWRNGQPIRVAFFDNPSLEWSFLTGKSRSAVEVVSCTVTFSGDQPPMELARQVLSASFRYGRRPGTPDVQAANQPKP